VEPPLKSCPPYGCEACQSGIPLPWIGATFLREQSKGTLCIPDNSTPFYDQAKWLQKNFLVVLFLGVNREISDF